MLTSQQRTLDLERHFIGDRQIEVSHFYSVGNCGGAELFAVGYRYPDDGFVSGLFTFDGERFRQFGRTLFVLPDEPIDLTAADVIGDAHDALPKYDESGDEIRWKTW